MLCIHCGEDIPQSSKVCPMCGKSTAESKKLLASMGKRKNAHFSGGLNFRTSPDLWRWGLICVAAAVLVVALVLAVVFWIVPLCRYRNACRLLDKGEYLLAERAFSHMGDYRDAEELSKEARYLLGHHYRNNREYTLANSIFAELGTYKNSHLFIHIHDYQITDFEQATCTSDGRVVHTCPGCGDFYVEPVFASHRYVLTEAVAATCTAGGSRNYRCDICGHTKLEEVKPSSHEYTEATCTKPATCLSCGETGEKALGHTEQLFCGRCGVKLFENRTYQGKGPGYLQKLSLPAGKYNMIFTHKGEGNFTVYFSEGDGEQKLIVNQIGEVSYVYRVVSRTNAPIRDGYLNIIAADGEWTVTVEALSNDTT